MRAVCGELGRRPCLKEAGSLQAVLVCIVQKMEAVAKPTKVGLEESPEVPIHRIRITLTSRNVRNLEKGELQDLVQGLWQFCHGACDDLAT